MSQDRLPAGDQEQVSGTVGAKGLAKVILVPTAIGAFLGVVVLGLMEWLPALVLPHGGWEHVHLNHPRLGAFALSGGAAGLALGVFIAVVRRAMSSSR